MNYVDTLNFGLRLGRDWAYHSDQSLSPKYGLRTNLIAAV